VTELNFGPCDSVSPPNCWYGVRLIRLCSHPLAQHKVPSSLNVLYHFQICCFVVLSYKLILYSLVWLCSSILWNTNCLFT